MKRLILISAALLIGFGILVYRRFGLTSPSESLKNSSVASQSPAESQYPNQYKMSKFMRPADKDDHMRGNIDAPVKIVEFSDLECPFCKKIHPVLKQIVKDYDGKVVWLYRHFPLDAIHRKARKEAEASECANELGGNGAFWNYIDRVFEVTLSNDSLDLSLLPKIADEIGLNQSTFQTCLESDKYNQRIARDLSDAMTSGGKGTPYVVIVGPNNKRYDFSGAQPYEVIKDIVELALSQN